MHPDSRGAGSRPLDRRGVFSWMLFDWANQPFYTLILTFIFAPYFTSQVVGDPVAGQSLWGAATAVAGLMVAVLSPPLGAIADRTGGRKAWALAFSLPYVTGCLGLWLATPGMGAVWPVLLAFGLAYLGSELTILYTNAMLPDLGPREEIGRISGSGWALGYVGGLVSLILVLTLLAPAPGSGRTLIGIAPVLGLDPALGEPARATGPLSALWYVIFVIPLFLWSPDAPRSGTALGAAARAGLRDLGGALRMLTRERSLGFYLLASMIYRDALAALFIFGGVYAAGVLGWGTFELGVFGVVSAGTGALGAWLGGRADRALGPMPVIATSATLLILVCLLVLATTRSSVLGLAVAPEARLPDLVFLAAGGLLGAAAGALQAASRTMLVHQAEGRMGTGQAFGLYALAGKATAFIGPAAVAATTAATGSQRLGVAPIVGLFAIALVLLSCVRTGTEQPRTSAT
ncbi:MFS transporter [Amaricoccus solimangrovi]|uniref:MFS transporter n=1 Tax=Amaricoccus solimangrovi TaxID=2589815 RepID=A0A501WN24_9RHOB|nr:MFS transporter [Amaricoccus solimangrovi]TPE50252.1 MFS transporter [Amaricoccus solimangrovi]